MYVCQISKILWNSARFLFELVLVLDEMSKIPSKIVRDSFRTPAHAHNSFSSFTSSLLDLLFRDQWILHCNWKLLHKSADSTQIKMPQLNIESIYATLVKETHLWTFIK